jgi:hypothetical protein
MKPVTHTKTSKPRRDLSQVVVAVTKAPLDHLESTVLSRFAKAVWYETDEVYVYLEKRLSNPNLPQVRKRRLLYLVDRLRRFPCLTPEHATDLKRFVARWSSLANSVDRDLASRAARMNRYDKLAATWGLVEDVSSLMSKVLEFQTRHYVDEHRVTHGYSQLKRSHSAIR